jgi:hypothetical protein
MTMKRRFHTLVQGGVFFAIAGLGIYMENIYVFLSAIPITIASVLIYHFMYYKKK